MSFQAYTNTLKATENTRNTEYRLFAEITGEMIQAAQTGKKDSALAEALNRNRQLWQTLAGDCKSSGNGLPEQLRASIISLSIWVTKFSGEVLRNAEDIQELIEVNRIIMKGLQPSPASPSPGGGGTSQFGASGQSA